MTSALETEEEKNDNTVSGRKGTSEEAVWEYTSGGLQSV